jgi:hypothetical protein
MIYTYQILLSNIIPKRRLENLCNLNRELAWLVLSSDVLSMGTCLDVEGRCDSDPDGTSIGTLNKGIKKIKKK